MRRDGFGSSDQWHMLVGVPNGVKIKMAVSDIAVNEVSCTRIEARGARRVRLTCFAVFAVGLFCSVYASIDARGLYADAAALLIVIYGGKSFFVSWGPRAFVDILRQAPVVFLSHFTSVGLLQCGRVLSFAMLALPTLLSSACWWIAPRGGKTWVLFPVASLLIGFAATSMNAVGEAAIATGYYWILFFTLLFRVRSWSGKALFLLLCLPAFWLHEGAFLLTILLLACLVTRVHSAARRPHEALFAGIVAALLLAILGRQIYFVIYPLFPDDRAHIWQGLTQFEFLYFEDHFNLPIVTGSVAAIILCALTLVRATRPAAQAAVLSRTILIAWTLLVLAAIAVAIFVEQSFSPFTQMQARYHPALVSAALGGAMVLLMKFRVPCRVWAQPATCLVLLTLCAAQAAADIVATDRWDAYVKDLQSRLAASRGLIPWESTLHSGDAWTDANWRLFKIGWVVPHPCVIFSKDGVVGALIDFPEGTTLRLLDPERPDLLPEIRGIDFAPYQRAFERAGTR